MANPSKLTLYLASTTIGGGVTTLVKPKIVLSELARQTVEQHAPYLINLLGVERDPSRWEGNVKLPASLEEASIQLVNYIAPVITMFRQNFRHISLNVMFNEPTINTAIKNGSLEKWRAKQFEYKMVGRKKEVIPHASKWYMFDTIMSELNGTAVWYNDDEIMYNLVDNLKRKPGRKQYDFDASISVSSD